MSLGSPGSRRFPFRLGRLAPTPATDGAGWATYPDSVLRSLGSQVPRFYRNGNGNLTEPAPGGRAVKDWTPNLKYIRLNRVQP